MSRRVPPRYAAKVAGVTARTLHRWAREGLIKRYPDGFDLAELRAAAEARNLGALLIRAGIPKDAWPEGVASPSRKPTPEVESDDDGCARTA